MRSALPLLLLVAGLALIGYGFSEKDKHQTTVDIGVAELELGKKDSAFSPWFIGGGITAIAGLALLLAGRKRS